MAVKKARRRARVPPAPKSKEAKHGGKIKDKKTLVVAQEIKFTRLLVHKEKRVRDKVLKNLRKWLTVRSASSFAFTEDDFMRLWKGLFYCMWMSDKPLVQEELAESLSKIVHCFNSKDVVLLYTMCALQTLATEWFGIDQFRIDKFAMLVRRIFRQTFQVCKNRLWDVEWVEGISEMFQSVFLHPKTSLGFVMHTTEIYLEELAKISGGKISEDVTTILIKPFLPLLVKLDDERRIRHIMQHIFRYLIVQSDIGMEYREKFEAWRQAGFPGGHIDAMEKLEVSDEEEGSENEIETNSQSDEENKPLDPRAGRVNVELPQLPFDPEKISVLLSQYRFHPSSTATARRQIARLTREFVELSRGEMPIGIKEVKLPDKAKHGINPTEAALRLLEFERELYADNEGKKKKKKKKKNGQIIEDENNSDDLVADTSENTLQDVEQETNKRKDPPTSLESEISDTPTAPVKKKRKIKSLQEETFFNELNIDNDKSEDTKQQVSSLSKTSNKKTKLAKVKQNDKTSTPNGKKTIKPKKLKPHDTSDNWDISDNTDCCSPSSPVCSNGTTDVTGSDNSVPEKVKSDNDVLKSFDKRFTWLTPVLTKLEEEKRRSQNLKNQTKFTDGSSPKKRVKIVLQRNTTQHTSEYIQQIRQSPAIPFDANKKPPAGVLKASPIPSPVNPFYKKSFQ